MDGVRGGRQVLRILGLGEDEEQVYRTLLRLSTTQRGQLARYVPLTDERIARALDGLRERGLVAPAGAGPDPPLRPLPPDVALGDELLRQQHTLDQARHRVAQLTEEYRAGLRRHDADHLVEIVTGADALRARLRRLQDDARTEVLWFCRANPLAMPGPENVEEFAALARGVSYRAIYERDLLAEPGALADVEKAVRCGEQARVTDTLPVRLAIADRTTAICPLVPDRTSGEPSAALIGRVRPRRPARTPPQRSPYAPSTVCSTVFPDPSAARTRSETLPLPTGTVASYAVPEPRTGTGRQCPPSSKETSTVTVVPAGAGRPAWWRRVSPTVCDRSPSTIPDRSVGTRVIDLEQWQRLGVGAGRSGRAELPGGAGPRRPPPLVAGIDPRVQPDSLDAAAEPSGRRRCGHPGLRGAQRGPEAGQLLLADREGRAVDAGQRPYVRRLGGERADPVGAAVPVPDDQRQPTGGAVAEPVRDELLDVEQVRVQHPTGQVRHHVGGQHPELPVDGEGVEGDLLPAGRGPDGGRQPSGRRLVQLDDVAGDEGDPRRGGPAGGGRRSGSRWRG
ncbi:TrmB family transcriptional regulator, partial [Micromonospora globispora]|uniref:TrmB family transcriptional regulator n=1 Tax=Micromonospora globispora TaxID=1450148 RepID=UPI0014029A7A